MPHQPTDNIMHPAIKLLKKIPRGNVATYKELARVCNTAPRAIGYIMAHNRHPQEFPCYKIVSSSGELTGYSAPGGVNKKRELLEKDGVRFIGDRVDKSSFYTFKMRPLQKTSSLTSCLTVLLKTRE